METRSFCRICTAMCGIVVTTDAEQVVRVRGDADHPVSAGYTCAKGRALPAFHHHPDRLNEPVVAGVATSWPEAVEDLGGALHALVADHGPDSVAMYLASGSAYDALGRRAAERFLTKLGSLQKYTATTVDTPSKPLVAELVGGWTGLTPMWDYRASKLLLLFGTNPVVSHGHSNGMPDPVTRLRAQRDRGALWVVDPRRTETAQLADQHLAIAPSTDHVVLAFLVRELLEAGANFEYLATHAIGVDKLRAAVAPFTLDVAAPATGLDTTDLLALLEAVRAAGQISALTGTGVSMNKTANVTEWLLWALHIVTGSYDRPGGMWFNPGYLMQLDTREWAPGDGVPEPGPASRPELPRRFGEYPCAGLVDEIEAGNIRALIVAGGNPIVALPDVERTRAAFAKLDVLAVVDVIETDTTKLATHVLPAAAQLERADVPWLLDAYQPALMTHYTEAVVPPGFDRRPMWEIFDRLGQRCGVSVVPEHSTEDTLLDRLMDGGRTNATTIRNAPTATVFGEPVFGWVHKRVLPNGRWRLAPEALVEQLRELDLPAASGQSVLLPRRQPKKMNGQLREITDDVVDIEISIERAEQSGITDGQMVRVTSANGSLTGCARVNPGLRTGAISIPHGWAEPNVGSLTSGQTDIDPLTGMVWQSGVPVTVEPVDERRPN